MTALEVYAILKKKIETASTGIADIRRDGEYIVFEMADGTEFRIEDETKDIIDVDINDENYIVITYIDGSTTTSDKPIPQQPVMTGATEQTDGTKGLVPAPAKGDLGYLNNRGEWDASVATDISNLKTKVDDLDNVVPTQTIPDGATLTSDGWAATDDTEIADEFAKWED